MEDERIQQKDAEEENLPAEDYSVATARPCIGSSSACFVAGGRKKIARNSAAAKATPAGTRKSFWKSVTFTVFPASFKVSEVNSASSCPPAKFPTSGPNPRIKKLKRPWALER